MSTERENNPGDGPFAEEFGGRLKAVIPREMTIESLAQQVGVSTGAIYEWQAGRRIPSLQNTLALAKALNVSFEWLASGEGDRLSVSTADRDVEPAEVEVQQIAEAVEAIVSEAITAMRLEIKTEMAAIRRALERAQPAQESRVRKRKRPKRKS